MPFNIVVVGSGIGGLSAAIALRNKGHDVTIVEATAELRPIGGIVTLQANASRMLDHLGVYKALLPYCNAAPHGPSTRYYEDGANLASVSAQQHERDYGYPVWPVHRADLQRVLIQAIYQRGVKLRLGCPVIAIDESQRRPAILIRGGGRIEADIIVGADGINSVVRQCIAPNTLCIRDSGMDVTRATIPASVVKSDAVTADFLDHVALWCGPPGTIAVMAVRGGDQQLLGLDCCHARLENDAKADGSSQDVMKLREYYKTFAQPMQKVLEHVNEARVWKLRESMPPSWVSRGGKVVLIGDAAHAALPWLGQGAGMAIEDGASLAAALDWADDATDIENVLRAFEDIRKPRCDRVQEWSAIKGRRAFLNQLPELQTRHAQIGNQDFDYVMNAWRKPECWNKIEIDDIPELGDNNWKAWLCGHHAPDFVNRKLDVHFSKRRSFDSAIDMSSDAFFDGPASILACA